jgi:hypothetical protein
MLIGDRGGLALGYTRSPRGAIGVGTRDRCVIIAVGPADILFRASTVTCGGNEYLWHNIAGFGGAGMVFDNWMGVATAVGIDLFDTHDVTGPYGVLDGVFVQR